MRQIHLRAAEIARGDAQPLLLAATSALAVGLLPQALKSVEAQSGAVPIQLRSASPEQVSMRCSRVRSSWAFAACRSAHRGLRCTGSGDSVRGRAAARDPLARHAVVPLAALAQRRIVTMSNPFRLRHRLDANWRAPATRRRSGGADRDQFLGSAQASARAGLGVAVLEPLTARGAPLEGLAVRPLDTDIPFVFGVVTPQSRPLTPPVRA